MKNIQEIYEELVGENYKISETDLYIKSYPYYTNFFSSKNDLIKEDIILGLGLVYSWMPTIPKNIKFDALEEALPILNCAKNGYILKKEDYITLKRLSNNSLVATSKLLHFINPESFAIWDSKIYAYLYQEKAHKYKVEDIDKYIAYLDLLNRITHLPKFESIIKNTQAVFNNKISKYRAIEWMFFNKSNII